jgi:hypothetical protein
MQILIDDFGFAKQIGDVFLDDFDQAGHALHLLAEFVGEFLLLLVAPRFFQRYELAAEQIDAGLDLRAELLQILGELPKFIGIDDCLRHGGTPKKRRCEVAAPTKIMGVR